jgi:hypothetical protein
VELKGTWLLVVRERTDDEDGEVVAAFQRAELSDPEWLNELVYSTCRRVFGPGGIFRFVIPVDWEVCR